MRFLPTQVQGHPAGCYACGFSAIGAGVPIGRVDRGADPRYLCKDCVKLAKEVAVADLDSFEAAAIVDAGKGGGQYLDNINKTDLADMTQDQYREFIKRVVMGFASSIREQARQGFK